MVSVSINGSTDYKASDMFNDDVKIVVHYSSNDRIDITSTIKDWKKKSGKKKLNLRICKTGYP